MTKPKPKNSQASKPNATKPLKTPQYVSESEAEQTPVFLAAPDSLYAQVRGIDDTTVLHPVVALRYQNEKMVAFIPVDDEIVPVTEVERFEEFVWDFSSEAGEVPDENTDDADDEDDKDDPDTEDEDDKDDEDDEDDEAFEEDEEDDDLEEAKDEDD